MHISKILKIIFISVILFINSPLYAGQKNICFIIGKKIKPYIEMINGFAKVSNDKYKIFDLSEDNPDKLTLKQCGYVISTGTKSNFFLTKLKLKTPKIYSFFLYENEIKNYYFDNQTSAIYLYPEPEKLLKYFKTSKINKIIAPYSEEKVKEYLVNACKLFADNGITLKTIKIFDYKEFDIIYKNKNFKYLWVLPDKLYSSKRIIDYLISNAVIRDMDVIGFNRYFYNSGAKFSVIIDYKGIGELLKKIIDENSKNIVLNAPFKFQTSEEK